jgi:DNA invertase Pin-like site-specific DNA recombinase
MITAIYIRTSTEEQNPELQLNDCESINKYGQYELFKDKQSAWKDYKEREDFEKLKIKIKKRQIIHLIVWDLDRIYRNRTKLKAFFEFCKVYDCKIHSYRQEWLEDVHKIPPPFNEIIHELLIQIMGWMAEDESKKKSDRVKMAIRKKIKGTYSYKGNKWGRKSLSTFKQNQLKKYIEENPNISIRGIASNLELSKSVVHKYITKYKLKKMEIEQSIN